MLTLQGLRGTHQGHPDETVLNLAPLFKALTTDRLERLAVCLVALLTGGSLRSAPLRQQSR